MPVAAKYADQHTHLPSAVSLRQEHELRHRLGNMESDDRQQAPPLPPRTSFERTITVVRGNRSLGMFSVFLMVMVSWCVYVAGMAALTLIGGGDDGRPEEESWRLSSIMPETENGVWLRPRVRVVLAVRELPIENHFSRKSVHLWRVGKRQSGRFSCTVTWQHLLYVMLTWNIPFPGSPIDAQRHFHAIIPN